MPGALAALGLFSANVLAQTVITEGFQSTTATGWNFSRSATAQSTYTPLSGQQIATTGTYGLELSNNTGNTATAAQYNGSFSSAGASVYVQFDYQMFGGTAGTTAGHGGDGITFFLYDGSYANNGTFNPGAFGGSMGYAQRTDTITNGLTGGYLGVGLDAYGNFSSASEGRVGGYNNTTGTVTESIGVRGPGTGTSGYAYLGGTGAHLGTGNTAVNIDSGTNPTASNNTVQILLTATNQLTVTLAQGGSVPQTVLQMDLSGYARPDLLSFGFTAGSGGATDFMFVSNLTVTTLTASKWTNASGNGNWGLNTNWNPSVVPTNSADILFDNSSVSSAQSINLGGNRTVRSIAFDAPFDYTIDTTPNANTVTFNSGSVAGFAGIAVTQTHGSATDTVNSALVLNNNISVRNNASGTLNLAGTVATNGKTLTFDGTGTGTNASGVISGTGNIVKNDTGTVTLSAANTYSGGTTIASGTLNANNNTAFGTGTVTLSGGTLGSTNSASISNAITLSGNATMSGVTSGGILTQSGANRTLVLSNVTQNGQVKLSENNTNRTLTLQVDSGTSTIGGVISNGGTGTGSIVKTGAGTLSLTAANTFTGSTTISDGTVQLGGNDRLSATSSVRIDASGTLDLNGFSQKIGGLTALNGGASINFGATGTANNFVFGTYTAPSSGVLVINNFENGTDKLATSVGGQNVSTIYISGYGTAQVGTSPSATVVGTYGSGYYMLSPAAVATNVWDGSSSNVWSTGSNWSLGSRPTSSQIAVFNSVGNAQRNITLDAARSVGGLQFASDALSYTIGGANTLTLSGTVPYIQQQSANTQTISALLSLGGNTVADVTGSGNLVISGALSGTGNLVKDGMGSGKLVLSGSNGSYTGDIYVNNGIVQAAAANSLGASANTAINIAQGATLELSNSGTAANTINVAGTGVGAAGAIHNVAGSNTLSGTITQSGSTSITADTGSTLTLSGNLTGTGASTTFGGAGNINVAQISNSGSGTVTVSSTGTVTYNGGTTANTFTGTTTVQSGTLALAKTAGTAAIAGNLVVNGGAVQLTNSNQMSDAVSVTLNNSGTFNVNGKQETIGQINSSSSAATVALGTGGQLTINAVNNQNSSYGGTITGSGTSSLNISGTGKVYLSNSNTGFAGTTNVNGGTLNVSGSNTALGTGAVNVASGGNLQLQGGVSLSNAVTINGTGTSGNGAIENFAGNNTLSGTVTLAGNSRIESSSGALTVSGNVSVGATRLTVGGTGNTTISGTISGTGGLTKADSGTLTLTKANQTFGGTALTGGTLVVGAVNALSSNATLTISSGATLSVSSGLTQVVTGLTAASGSEINLGANAKLTVSSASATSLIASVTGTGTLAFTGGGNVTLGTNFNFGGELSFGGTTIGGTPSSTLVVSGNVTLGTLHITGDTILDFGNSTATTLNATNLIIDAGVKVSVINWVNMTDMWVAQNFQGSVLGQRGNSPVPNNASTQITFTGFSNNQTVWTSWDHEITPAPEPSTYGAIFIGATLGLVGYRRWRKRT